MACRHLSRQLTSNYTQSLVTITGHGRILHGNSRPQQQMEESTTDQRSPSSIGTIQRLQDGNAALKAELQALRSTAQLQASQAESRKEQTFDFLGLPAELCDAIYELCVSVGEVRIACCNQTKLLDDMRYNPQRDRKAEMSLFGVSRAIRCEALRLYLSKNHFVIPTTDVWSHSIYSSNFRCYISQHLGTPLVHEHLRSISISFNCADIFERAVNEITAANFIDFHYEADTEEECDDILQSHNELAFERCREFADTLCSNFVVHQQLRGVRINLQNATCRTECHRLVVALFEDDVNREELDKLRYEVCTRRMERLDFLGTISKKERRTTREAFTQCIRSKITFHGQWNSDRHDWDADVEVFDETPSKSSSPVSS
jgi:hypothetical protein